MAKKVNPWTVHVKEVSKQNPGMKFIDVLKKAKVSYKKHKPQHGGGALGGSLSPTDVTGMSKSSGTDLQVQATQFSGGKKSKRRGSKRSGSKRSSRGTKRSGSKRSSRGTKRRSRGGMPPLSPGDLKNVEFF
jgi:hypothetical protein